MKSRGVTWCRDLCFYFILFYEYILPRYSLGESCMGRIHITSAGTSTTHVRGRKTGTLCALFAPLSWVQFALLWIFAVGTRLLLPPPSSHLDEEVNAPLIGSCDASKSSHPGAHLPAWLFWLPTGNWDIPPYSLLIIKVTWHMYSRRSVNLHCGHIFLCLLSVSARCPLEGILPSQVIKDPAASHLAGPIIKTET